MITQKKSWKILKRVLGTLFLLYCCVLLWLYLFQRDLVFHPTADTKMPDEYGLKQFENILVTTDDQTKIQLWYKKAKENHPTVVYFPGNAQSLGNRQARFAEIAKTGYGLLALSYRGYGQSEGFPTEQGLYSDARAAMSHATTQLNIPSRQMILYGESLGTAVAAYAATEYAVGGLILDSPPVSVLQRGRELYPYVPVEWLLKDVFPTLDRITEIDTPLLILHGGADSIIPVSHGRALYAAAERPKKIIVFKHEQHVATPASRIAEEIVRFAAKHQLAE